MITGSGRKALLCALLAGAAVSALGSAAIAADQSSSGNQQIETVVVTGSMLRRTDTETASPVTILTKDQITASGLTSTSDVLRSLSADSSGTIPTAFGAGFAAGSSGIALRGLTVNSTLVLINGRRTANYPLADDGERGFVDLNTIPLDVVSRVEVLKDGASSLYGADAIGGVVNIILDPTYVGQTATAETGTTEHGGGFMTRFAGTAGYGDPSSDKFNAFINFEYEEDQAIRVCQRGFPFNTNDLSSIGGFNLNGTTSIYGAVQPTHLIDPNDPTSGSAALAPLQILAPGGCGPLGKQLDDDNGEYCQQNLALYGDDQPRQIRYGGYTKFTLDVNAHAQAYLDASYFQNNVSIHGGPPNIRTTTPNNTTLIALPATLSDGSLNPNDPFAAAGEDALIRYAFGDIKGGSQYENHIVRVSLGMTGDWLGWNYDTAAVVAHSWLNSESDGFLNFNQLIADIRDGSYDFINPSNNSAAVRAALAPPLTKVSTTDMDSIDVRLTRPLFSLPGGDAQLGVGAEIRHEATDDPDLNPGLAAQGLGFVHTIGNRTVYSTFAELDMPIMKTLEANVSGRFDHYSDFGDTFNPKFGLKWTPIPEIALRGTFSRGFRAPSFSENGSAAVEGFIITEVPCDVYLAHGGTICTDTDREGGDEYVQPYSLGLETTANPKIKPETSQNYTLGTVIQPWDNVNVSVDYYNIHKKNIISGADPFGAIDDFYNGVTIPPGFTVIADKPDPQFPTAPVRVAVVGAPYINAQSLTTNGIDVELQGNWSLAPQLSWTTDVQATRIFTYRFTFPGSAPLEYVGTQSPYITSSGAGTPQDRMTWSNTLTWDKLDVTATVYYISGIKPFESDACGAQVDCAYGVTLKGEGDPFWDVDLTARYQITDNLQIFGGVKNIADARPPIDPPDYAAVNYNPTYDQAGIVGRFFSVGVTIKNQ